jgi:Oxidoreductase family, NAD-binding Rossmann fold
MTRVFAVLVAFTLGFSVPGRAADLRLGLVGTDTSHVIGFATAFNDPSSPNHVPGARIVAAFKGGSPDLPQSRDRIENFTRQLQEKYGIEIVGSIAELCKRVDGILLTSVDGRVHLAQAREIINAHKPMFIDKPLASTLEDAREIARLARQAGVPWFSTSTLRYSVAKLKTVDLSGADVWGPGPLEEHHQLDLSWYAIHEAEMLFTLLGTGCEEVTRVESADAAVVACRWKDGRIGTMRALRPYSDYGVVVFRKDAKGQTSQASPVRTTQGDLDRDLLTFFTTGVPPVPNDETLELMAFLDAAQRSKEAGGRPMRLR